MGNLRGRKSLSLKALAAVTVATSPHIGHHRCQTRLAQHPQGVIQHLFFLRVNIPAFFSAANGGTLPEKRRIAV